MKRRIINFVKKSKFLHALFIRLNEFIRAKFALRRKIKLHKKEYREYGINRHSRKIFLFGTPNHSNLGDQAQTYCTIEWLKSNYPDYTIYDLTAVFLQRYDYWALKAIKKVLTKDDKIFLQSGYNTTNLYMREENLHRAVLTVFKKHKVVILPQTVYFTDKVEYENTKRIYNAHPKLVFFARDDVSFQTAKEMFPQKRLFLYPDIVTSLIGRYSFPCDRKGILMCTRNDIEALYSKDDLQAVANRLSVLDSVDFTDTTIPATYDEILKDRKKYLNSAFEEYSKYRLIITDRYHGTIFSLIGATPVIVINSTDHKLSSGVKWFKECSAFNDYVFACDSLDDIYDAACRVLNKKLSHTLPAYFNTEYYDKLKAIIEGE